MALGCILAAIAAGVLKFLLLPSHETYEAFSLLLAAFLIPGGAVATVPGIGATAFLYDVNLIPMLSPTNHMVYDFSAFLNNGLAIVVRVDRRRGPVSIDSSASASAAGSPPGCRRFA